ncbi:MAG: Mpo1-like protein [Gemmataceae bacterium]
MAANTEEKTLGPIRRFLRKRLKGWLLRHQLSANFWIHMIGIPMAVAGVVCWLTLPFSLWWLGAMLFVMGYFLQWIGHCWEGNDVGEWAAIKRLFGLPYIGIAPRWNPEDPNQL